MKDDLKYALDKLFLFMLIVSVAVFIISMKVHVDQTILTTVEILDMIVLGGYYLFFVHGFKHSSSKVKYCKRHWIMIALLILPFLPISSLLAFTQAERVFAISSNTMWHFLDEIQML